MDAVARWLAVRIVWWDMRGEWCELLYRHRVYSTRMDLIEQRLGQVRSALGWTVLGCFTAEVVVGVSGGRAV